MGKQITRESLEELHKRLNDAANHRKFNRIFFFEPYPKQQQFLDMGAFLRERLLMAGNQLGKSETGADEVACHLTGEYPDDWMGRRWDRPVKGWAAGETSLVVRDVQQKKLCGEAGVEELFGTGFIPKAAFVDKPSLARGVTDAYDTIQVRHKSGGISVLRFKSYEQGRKKFQGETVDFVWFDEEPPMEIYSEGLTRITATKGMVFVTFTPLQGRSSVVNRYLDEPSPDRGHVIMTIEDALHILPDERAKIIAGYPPHERDARSRGIPMLGSGRIFPYSDDAISEEPISFVPNEWAKLWGTDFGIDHPFGAILIAWDKDLDIIHVLHTIRVTNQLPLQHAAAMKPIARNVPVAWPQDGTARESTGLPLAHQYKAHGLNMLHEHATWPEGGVSTEAGVMEMQERFTTGRLKIAKQLSDLFAEIHLYHRKDGMIVKVNDDLLSALRIAIMMKRYARPGPLGGQATKRRKNLIAEGVDFDVHA